MVIIWLWWWLMMVNNNLVGGFEQNPSEKWWSSSVEMMKFPIWKNNPNVPNHQPVISPSSPSQWTPLENRNWANWRVLVRWCMNSINQQELMYPTKVEFTGRTPTKLESSRESLVIIIWEYHIIYNITKSEGVPKNETVSKNDLGTCDQMIKSGTKHQETCLLSACLW